MILRAQASSLTLYNSSFASSIYSFKKKSTITLFEWVAQPLQSGGPLAKNFADLHNEIRCPVITKLEVVKKFLTKKPDALKQYLVDLKRSTIFYTLFTI